MYMSEASCRSHNVAGEGEQPDQIRWWHKALVADVGGLSCRRRRTGAARIDYSGDLRGSSKCESLFRLNTPTQIGIFPNTAGAIARLIMHCDARHATSPHCNWPA